MVDGKVVAVNDKGIPDFGVLQNWFLTKLIVFERRI